MNVARLLVPLALFAFLLACPTSNVDTDGDGLLDTEEEELGTDPELADSDGDGLDDGEEVNDYDTDPLEIDSDEDGYPDGAEVDNGSDPADGDDWIYEGGWPYNADKDDIDGADLDDVVTVDDVVGRLIGEDQFGDEVDLYDFAGHGIPIILDISAQWCPPCQATASWLAGGDDDYGLEGEFAHVREAVNNGEIYWVTIMAQDSAGDDPEGETCTEWDEDYPNHNVPCIADHDQQMMAHLNQPGFPNFHALTDDLVFDYVNLTDTQYLDYEALHAAADLAGL
jgi:thiol-disulfide isomerase/thioredoxin